MESRPRRQQCSMEYNGTTYDGERIMHGKHIFRQTMQVCGVGSQEDDVA